MASAFGLMLRVTQHAVWFGYWTFFAAALVGVAQAQLNCPTQSKVRTPPFRPAPTAFNRPPLASSLTDGFASGAG